MSNSYLQTNMWKRRHHASIPDFHFISYLCVCDIRHGAGLGSVQFHALESKLNHL